MKKFFFNSIFIILFILVIEFLSFNFIYSDLYYSLHSLKNFIAKKTNDYPQFQFKFLSYNEDKEYYNVNVSFTTRDCNDIPYNPLNKYIFFIGCSYTYGQGIKVNKTFNAQVQALTKRKTYNLSELGNGFSENWHKMASLPNKNYITEQERNNVEYVVYTLMYNHILRTSDAEVSWYLKQYYFKNRNNSFKDKLKYYVSKSWFIRLLLIKKFMRNNDFITKYQQYELLRLYNECMKNFPNSKFIFLIYDDLTNNNHEGLEKISLEPSY